MYIMQFIKYLEHNARYVFWPEQGGMKRRGQNNFHLVQSQNVLY